MMMEMQPAVVTRMIGCLDWSPRRPAPIKGDVTTTLARSRLKTVLLGGLAVAAVFAIAKPSRSGHRP